MTHASNIILSIPDWRQQCDSASSGNKPEEVQILSRHPKWRLVKADLGAGGGVAWRGTDILSGSPDRRLPPFPSASSVGLLGILPDFSGNRRDAYWPHSRDGCATSQQQGIRANRPNDERRIRGMASARHVVVTMACQLAPRGTPT